MPPDPDDTLLDLRAAVGEWVPVARHRTAAEAAVAVAGWLAHCEATLWRAFEFEARGAMVVGRFVGTVIRPPVGKKKGRPAIGVERQSRTKPL